MGGVGSLRERINRNASYLMGKSSDRRQGLWVCEEETTREDNWKGFEKNVVKNVKALVLSICQILN